ncbi:MAG: DNA internalization-related competence protein ComEC/Rec2 [Candidatus Omnitrophica bacterium]|nr:DNA internalization-related competence protein ComEC/Rec2 [Candidatus Omnitrophota bacterium]
MRSSLVTFLAALILWFVVGVVRTLTTTQQPPSHVVHALRQESFPVAIHGIVASDPIDLLDPNEEGQVAVLRVRHLKRDDRWQPTTGLVRARILEPRAPWIYGDEVLIEGELSKVPSPGNPGQYDWKAALARHHIHALLSVKPFHAAAKLREHQGRPWLAAIYALRHRIERLIDETFRPEHAGLLRSFLLGQRTVLDEGLKRAFVETGTIHLLVVSGFNVGLIAWLLEIGLRWLGWPLRLRLACSAICLLGYCLLTGMQAPVLRATVMAWVVLGAIWLDRLLHWPNALAAAALVIVWMNPLQLFDAGFQLSFGAVASLLVFTPRLHGWITSQFPTAIPWVSRYVSLTLAGTCAVWIGLWPLLAWYFHLVAPVSIVANLLLVPLVSVLVAAGTVVMLGGALMAPLMTWSAGFFSVWLDAIVACVQWCHRVPGGWWVIGHPSWWLITGYYGLIMVTLMRRRLHLGHGQLLACWLFGLSVWVWSGAMARIQQVRWLDVTALDVGHGDALVIRTPGRQTLLVDTGTQEAGEYVVVPFLRYHGIGDVDALILTHFDEDHLGGALPLLQSTRVRRMFTNGAQPTTPTGHQVLAMARAKRIPVEPLWTGMRLTGLGGADMMVLHPPKGRVPGTRPESNDNSIVAKLMRGKVSWLLCADIEEAGLPWLLAWRETLHSTILKVPHHGSALGREGRRFAEQVRPSVALISVGRRHGLPATSTLDELNSVGSQIMSTREAGAVTIRTDGMRLLVTNYRKQASPQPKTW